MNIHFTPKAFKVYNNLPSGYKTILNKTLDKLRNNVPVDIKPLQGEKDVYRIRFGKYRILLNKIESDYLIFRIDTRGDIYK